MSNEIPNTLTLVTPNDVYASMCRAWEALLGETPKRESVLTLLAQWALETGRGASMHCYNIGNVKHVPGDGRDYTYFACNEVLNGKVVWFYPKDPACCFRAFTTLDAGVADYLALLKQRFAGAWPAVLSGDPVAFGHALKVQRYYTADEHQYCATLSALFNEFSSSLGHSINGVPVDLHTVKGQQAALNALGADPQLTVDGDLGPKTKAAIQWFQKDHGLTVDGNCGPATVKALGVAVDALSQG